MSRKHAILSASSADRWIHCPPSALINDELPDTTSIYAAEGTLAHKIGELGLRLSTKEITKRKYNSELKKLRTDELFYEGMIDEVQDYVDLVIELYEKYKEQDPATELFIEQRLDYSRFAPEGFGTGDAVILTEDTVHVIDLKFGRWVHVNPYENAQLKLYALGAHEELGFLHDLEKAKVTVAQVRLENTATFETTIEDLLIWAETVVQPAAVLAIEGKGDFLPGDWCTFCKFKNQCKARNEHFLKIYEEHKDRELSTEELAALLPSLDEIKRWATDLQEAALEDILSGREIPGWKAVEGRSIRKITDEEGLAEVLLKDYSEEEIFRPRSLQTITNLEKLAGKKYFADISGPFITKPPGKPTLAPEYDKRPPINDISTELEFNK